MKKILLLGSGELGKEFVIACQRKGQYVVACDKYDNAPAMQVADERRVFSMLDGDALMKVVEEVRPDIIVPEIEAIRTEKLYECEKMGIQVVPSARAVNFTMNRKAIRELAHTELGLKTANYRYATTFEELAEAADVIGFPCIIKPLMSSSGHGQSKVDSAEELASAWACACEGSRGDIMEVIVEQFIPFDYEITLLTVTQKNGPTLFCAPIGHVQKGGDYQESFQPRQMKVEHLAQAQEMAAKVTEALTGAGIWGVEFFVSEKEGVIFSELSPRPHDTGMVTLAGTQNLSEFELHCRAVLGLPIPEITQERQGASAVILSGIETKSPDYTGMEDACAEQCTYLRIFGKPEAHVGRRMGVVVCWDTLDADQEALRNKCKNTAAKVTVTEK
ncbi:MAG: formate-dependent phosphoribosylglycinamide formyltransferase [Bacteroidaceae bacterium]|nr:formate-dependent phosphoribosylglycinamide formyltransferase [Bacteroidaceae bacterium]